MVLPLEHVMSSPKPFDDSDSHTIAQILHSFQISSIINVLSMHLVDEFSSEHPYENNQLVSICEYEQPTP